jgi:hypothetical protein
MNSSDNIILSHQIGETIDLHIDSQELQILNQTWFSKFFNFWFDPTLFEFETSFRQFHRRLREVQDQYQEVITKISKYQNKKHHTESCVNQMLSRIQFTYCEFMKTKPTPTAINCKQSELEIEFNNSEDLKEIIQTLDKHIQLTSLTKEELRIEIRLLRDTIARYMHMIDQRKINIHDATSLSQTNTVYDDMRHTMMDHRLKMKRKMRMANLHEKIQDTTEHIYSETDDINKSIQSNIIEHKHQEGNNNKFIDFLNSSLEQSNIPVAVIQDIPLPSTIRVKLPNKISMKN